MARIFPSFLALTVVSGRQGTLAPLLCFRVNRLIAIPLPSANGFQDHPGIIAIQVSQKWERLEETCVKAFWSQTQSWVLLPLTFYWLGLRYIDTAICKRLEDVMWLNSQEKDLEFGEHLTISAKNHVSVIISYHTHSKSSGNVSFFPPTLLSSSFVFLSTIYSSVQKMSWIRHNYWLHYNNSSTDIKSIK